MQTVQVNILSLSIHETLSRVTFICNIDMKKLGEKRSSEETYHTVNFNAVFAIIIITIHWFVAHCDNPGSQLSVFRWRCFLQIIKRKSIYFIWTYQLCYWWFVGGTVASWLVRSTPERAVRVWALAGDIVLCSWARHFTLSASLHPGV